MNKILELIEKVEIFPNIEKERRNYKFSEDVLKSLSLSSKRYRQLKKISDNIQEIFKKNNDNLNFRNIERIKDSLPLLINLINEDKDILNRRERIGSQLNIIDEKLKDFEKNVDDEWKFNLDRITNKYEPFDNIAKKLRVDGQNQITSNLAKLNNFKNNSPQDIKNIVDLDSTIKILDQKIHELGFPDSISSFLSRAINGEATLEEYENSEIKNWIDKYQEIKKMLRLKL
jgi:hypothetical protein